MTTFWQRVAEWNQVACVKWFKPQNFLFSLAQRINSFESGGTPVGAHQ